MLEQFAEQYIPQNFPHREEQIKTISKVFTDWSTYHLGDNLIISGATGSGKTATIKKIISEHNNTLYCSGKENKTTKRIMSSLAGEKCYMAAELMQKLIKKLVQNPKILIIDEIHLVKDVTVLMDSLNEIYRQTNIPIIIITNQRGFISKMPEDARFTLFFQRVDFPSYNALQLNDILQDRIDQLDESIPKMPPEIKAYICAKVVHDYFGSARTVLDIAKKCYKNNSFSEVFINSTVNQLDEEEIYIFINKLSRTEKIFLQCLLELSMDGREINSSVIREKMQDASPSRISQLITTFVKDYAILTERYTNRGRISGRFRVVDFSSEKDKVSFYHALRPELYSEVENECNQ